MPKTIPVEKTSRISELASLMAARMVMTMPYRMVYPFAGVLARGLGVSLGAIAWIVTVRSALGALSPALGVFGDRWGRKRSLLLGALIFTIGMAVVVIWHTYTALFTGLILASLGKVIFDPASQAYIGDQVPYQRRGAAVAFVEVSWSGAFLIGMPVVAWLIAHGGWHAPFRWLALAGGLFILVVAFGLPASKAADRPAPLQAGSKRSFLPNRSALGMLAVAYLITTGAQNIFIVFGAWLENAFMVRVAALGIMAAAFGLAELIGEGLVAVLADNLGKRRALSGGLALSALAFFLLPFVGTSRLGAVVGLFSIFVCFEFSLVCAISLMTEMLPHARGTYMSLNVAVLEAAHGTGAVIGLLLFSAGIQANSAISAVLNLLALATLLRWVRPPSADSPNAAQRGQPQP